MGDASPTRYYAGDAAASKVYCGDALLWPTGVSYRDDFNRADSQVLGGDWRIDANGSARVASNRAMFKAMGANSGRAGSWMSYQGGSNSGRLSTDNYAVKAQLIPPVGGSAADNVTAIVLGVPDTFSSGSVCCSLVVTTGTGCAIVTSAGVPPSTGLGVGAVGQTQQKTVSTNIAATDLIELRRVGNTFTAYRNGATFGLSWTDSGNLVPATPANRRFGLIVEGNYPLFQQEFRSPAIDWIEAYDIAADGTSTAPMILKAA
ncbi:hypothetical protein [Nocardia acidivorans]|uniref:hypothetical protein n=1 Tax=Nocardia acidivorans TaxID=404580 RepID=UPI00082ECCF8|nr:hypothetical protein [Nocardia acidivorans]